MKLSRHVKRAAFDATENAKNTRGRPRETAALQTAVKIRPGLFLILAPDDDSTSSRDLIAIGIYLCNGPGDFFSGVKAARRARARARVTVFEIAPTRIAFDMAIPYARFNTLRVSALVQ